MLPENKNLAAIGLLIPYLTILVIGIDYYFDAGYLFRYDIPEEFVQIELTSMISFLALFVIIGLFVISAANTFVGQIIEFRNEKGKKYRYLSLASMVIGLGSYFFFVRNLLVNGNVWLLISAIVSALIFYFPVKYYTSLHPTKQEQLFVSKKIIEQIGLFFPLLIIYFAALSLLAFTAGYFLQITNLSTFT